MSYAAVQRVGSPHATVHASNFVRLSDNLRYTQCGLSRTDLELTSRPVTCKRCVSGVAPSEGHSASPLEIASAYVRVLETGHPLAPQPADVAIVVRASAEVTGHCTSCGACCDPVSLDHTFSRDELLTIANGIAQGGDADDAPISNYNPRNLHWLLFELKPLKAGYFACANFDAVTRQCNAYDTRPGVCAGFPWYGRQPYAGLLTGRLAGCGYAVDVPGSPDPQD